MTGLVSKGSRRRPLPGDPLPGFIAVGWALFLGLPVAALVVRAAAVGRLDDATTGRVVLDALVLSLFTTAASLGLAVLFGLPVAWLLARRPPRGAALLETLIDLPIVLPPSVAGLALLLVFGRQGVLGGPLAAFGFSIPFSTIAVIIAQTFVAAPFFIRAARAGLRSVHRDLEDAARVDGGGEMAVARSVTLPLAAPALAAGLVMAWARALGEFGATIMFAGNLEGRTQTLPLLVYSEFQASSDAAVVAASILVVAAFGVLLGVRLSRRGSVMELGAPG